MRFIFLLIILFATSCSSRSSYETSPDNSLDMIQSRSRKTTYRIRAPQTWVRRDPLPDESLLDTTKPLCEYLIVEGSNIIRIAIHNFPYTTADQPRIPPIAQATRWQNQIDKLFPHLSSIRPQSFSGYVGVLFTGVGIQKEKEIMVLGWALQVAPEHFISLKPKIDDPKTPNFKQISADVTIKAVGPRTLMEQHENEIIAFARSFELIEEF